MHAITNSGKHAKISLNMKASGTNPKYADVVINNSIVSKTMPAKIHELIIPLFFFAFGS